MLHGSKVKIKLDVLIPTETPYHTKRFLHGVNKKFFPKFFLITTKCKLSVTINLHYTW